MLSRTWRAGMENGLPRSVGGRRHRLGSARLFSGSSWLRGVCGARSPSRSRTSCCGSATLFFAVDGRQGGGVVYSRGRRDELALALAGRRQLALQRVAACGLLSLVAASRGAALASVARPVL